MYWRFDEEIQHIELDYPRDLAMWKGVPHNVDAVFQTRDKKTYFFKDKFFWQFNDKKMEVTRSSPMQVGEYWLHCSKKSTTHSRKPDLPVEVPVVHIKNMSE